MKKDILLACTDLFFSSRIESTARQLGADVRRLDAPPASVDAALLIVDLDCMRPEPMEVIRAVRSLAPDLEIVAFVRHDQAERIRAAREAGASLVLARGAFSERLPRLIGEAIGSS